MAGTALRGVYPVVSTPFGADGSIAHEDIERVIDAQVERGIHGVVLFGIGAEFYKLSDAERRAIVSTATDALAGTDTDLVVSVTDHATYHAVRFARFADDAGADAIMVLPPFFLGPSSDDLRAHVRRVGEAVDVPVIVQYAPEQTGVAMRPQEFVDLAAAVDTVRYFKIESRPPGPDISALTERLGNRGGVFVGYGGLGMIEALDRGADGVIPGAAISSHYLEVWDRYRAGDREAARRAHAAMVPLISHLIQDIEGFIHYEKRLLEAEGLIDATGARDPAFTPDEAFDRLFEEYYAALREDG